MCICDWAAPPSPSPCAILRILLTSGWDWPKCRSCLLKRRGGEEHKIPAPADSAVPTWLSRSSAPCAAGRRPSVALPDGSDGLGLLAWAGA